MIVLTVYCIRLMRPNLSPHHLVHIYIDSILNIHATRNICINSSSIDIDILCIKALNNKNNSTGSNNSK